MNSSTKMKKHVHIARTDVKNVIDSGQATTHERDERDDRD
jgi:hypothetical protein